MIKMSTAGEAIISLLENDKNCIVFLHNTKHEETAKMIMCEGFLFEEQLTYSCDRVNPLDLVEINYFLVERKEYGKFTIVIQISRDIFNKLNMAAEAADLTIEELLTISKPVLSDNDEYIYKLDPHFIKGYFDIKSGKFRSNKKFNPDYKTKAYIEVLKQLERRE